MKNLIGCIFLLFTWTSIVAQTHFDFSGTEPERQRHAFGDISLAGGPSAILNTSPYPSEFTGGIKMRVFMGEHFSFDTDLVFGKEYAHMGPGLIGLPLILLGDYFESEDQSLGGFLVMAAMVVLSVEHFAYHHPVGENTDLSPYVSLLRFRQFNNVDFNTEGFDSRTCFALGLELNHYINHFLVSPFIEYSHSYSNDLQGLHFGVYLGYNWYARK
jgi:hypothetical protein